ncbi:MAG: hypothetical protein E7442_01610 [Ruminococcaceae bacterium]|nr:hypothetical protein [Oscillospiraceae bacterium]
MAKFRKLAAALAVLLLWGVFPAAAASPLVAENLELETYRGTAVGGQLSAAAPQGSKLSYQITTEPSKGSVEVNADGSFIYTPEEGRRGRDYFGYKAFDEAGNASQEATVIIHLVKCKASFRYEDTAGLPCDYAAHRLAAEGLLQGQCVVGNYLFEPERSVSRGEFLSLCMGAAGVDPLRGITSTGCRDDDAIENWLKPYVSTALLAGYTKSDAVFGGDEALGRKEAAVILSRIFALTDAPGQATDEDDRAVMNLIGSGISMTLGEAPLTRGEAAMMLVEAME